MKRVAEIPEEYRTVDENFKFGSPGGRVWGKVGEGRIGLGSRYN